MKGSLLLTVAIAGFAGCANPTAIDFGSKPIQTPGTFHCFRDQLVVKVERAPEGKLDYSVGNKKVAAGPGKPALRERDPWVIFPEAADRVWIFDGAKDVTLIEISTEGASKFTSSQVVPDILIRAPAEFRRLLPADLAGEHGPKS